MAAIKFNTTFTPKRSLANDVLYSLEKAVRGIASEEISRATVGAKEGEDYVVLVNTAVKPKSAIRSMKLRPNPVAEVRYIRNVDLRPAARRALTYLQSFPFQNPTGKFKSLITIRADGRVIDSLDAPEAASAEVIEIYSRAAYASPLERIYDGRIFLAAAKRADGFDGAFATVSYREDGPSIYNQVPEGGRYLAVPVITITTPSNAGNLGRAAGGLTYRARRRPSRSRRFRR